jgi:hypothetical protein
VIISASHRYVFAAIPKTGTHAVRQALRPHLRAGDFEQVGLFVKRQLPIPALASLGHGHISLAQLRGYMDPEKFGDYFKFAFVRNPFDRFVSYCSFMARGSDVFATDPRRVMRHYVAKAPGEHVLFKPQHSFVEGAGGAMLADYIGRVETIQESFDFIASRIGIPAVQLQRVNSTERSGYRDYYDQQLIDSVARIYARDLELFGYEF